MPSQRPPLTTDQLHEIGVRNRGNADVIALLWEIKRLLDELEIKRQEGIRDYRIISRCYQISRSLPRQGGMMGVLIDDLKQMLEGHPVREYQDSIREDLRKARR